MFITANITTDLIMAPGPLEFRPFYRLFKDQITPIAHGYTLAAFDSVPDSVVVGAEYFGAIATMTRSFDTKQATLTNLKRVINIGNNEVIDASLGVRLPLGATINTGPLGMVINHIPQLFALYKDEVLVNFVGEFNMKTNLFRGQCDFLPLGEVWKG